MLVRLDALHEVSLDAATRRVPRGDRCGVEPGAARSLHPLSLRDRQVTRRADIDLGIRSSSA